MGNISSVCLCQWLHPHTNIIKMESFQTVKKLLNMMGIYSPQQNPNSRFHIKMFIFSFLIPSAFIQSFGFFLYGAESLFDYGISFYGAVTSLAVFITYALLIWKRANIYTEIERFDVFIGKSKCDRMDSAWTSMQFCELRQFKIFLFLLCFENRNQIFQHSANDPHSTNYTKKSKKCQNWSILCWWNSPFQQICCHHC